MSLKLKQPITRFTLLVAFALVFQTAGAGATVFVQPQQNLIRTSTQIGGGGYLAYPLPLDAGATLLGTVTVRGGTDNALQTWLLDLDNFQRFKSHLAFNYIRQGSSRVAAEAHLSFSAPATGVYYLLLDNRSGLFSRAVTVTIDQLLNQPNAESSSLTTTYAARYAALKNLFVFPDFDIYVRPCGTVNAFSEHNSGSVTICSELFEQTQREGIPDVELFVFTHEIAHTLLNLWGYPGYDNEDTADEFATMLLSLMGKEQVVLHAAQWFEAQNSANQARVQLILSDRHSLSVQRARNVLKWQSQSRDLERRWFQILIPKMRPALIEKLIAYADKHPPSNSEDVLLVREMHDTLAHSH